QRAGPQVLIGSVLGLHVGVEGAVRIDTVGVDTRAGVGDHDEALDSRLSCGIYRAFGGVEVDGLRAGWVPASGSGGEDDRLGAGEGIRERLRVSGLDVEHDGIGPGGFDIGGLLRVGMTESTTYPASLSLGAARRAIFPCPPRITARAESDISSSAVGEGWYGRQR